MYNKHHFTEGEKKCMEDYFKYASKTPRKNLIKLVKHINMLNPIANEFSWEYVFFDRMLTDEMVDFALKMKLRKPYYIADLAKVENMGVEECAKFAHELVTIGLLEYTSDEQGVDMVQLPVFAPGSMESTVMTKERTDAYPETAPAFLNYILRTQKNVGALVPMGQALMRAIPVEEAIKNEPSKVKYEEVSYWLDKAGESIAVAPCECRKLRSMVGEGTSFLEGDYCISLGKYAESCIRVGKARRISRAEAESILKDAEEKGFVHQLSNIDGPDFSLFICNCAWDTCMALRTSWYTQSPSMSRSNYVAEVEPEKCVACGGCVEVCPQNAAKLGQKLCQQKPVEIKNKEIADDHLLFGKKYWQTDFLTNRYHVVPETGTAPCKVACPAHISVQGYLRKAAEGKYLEALELIKKENPFPAVCGRVCAKFCEGECTRGEVDAAVAIDEVKKFIAEQELKAETRYVPKKMYDKGHKIAVIGSGPAGLSCAYYLAVKGHSVTVFEKEAQPGGMMRYGIPSFRLEKDVVDAEIDVIKQLGVDIKCNVEVGKDVTIAQLREEGYKGFYVAIGAQGGRKLGIAGENSENVVSGVEFLRTVANEEATSINGKAVVIGGGNVAIDVARTRFNHYWPADVHIIGKDILRFHTIYWPIILMALDLPLPKKVFGHPWFNFGVDKMSKSKGNVVYADELAEAFSVDGVRYYALSEMPYVNDGSITYENVINRYNTDLANNLGNLVSRTHAMTVKYFDGVIPAPTATATLDEELIASTRAAIADSRRLMEDYHVADALESIFTMLRRANKYIDETTPWALAKDPSQKERLGTVLYNLLETIRIASVLLTPFIPTTAESIQKQIATDVVSYDSLATFGALKSGEKLGEAFVLFARIDEAKFLAEQQAKKEAAEKAARAAEAPADREEEIGIDSFAKVELRTAQIIACEPVPKAKKLLKLQVDLGYEKRQIVSGIAKFYTPEQLIGKKIAIVANLAPAKLCGVESFGMLLASGEEQVRVVFLDPETPLGERIH